MPYVAPSEVASSGVVELEAIQEEMGPPPWRRPLVATDTTRWVLWAMPAGYEQPEHRHPHADEVFHVLKGRATFRFAGAPGAVEAGPGAVLHASRDVGHAIAVPGPEHLVLLVSVTPNQDVADETVS
jgi:quercetin dioxygenase-like cupin family protein